MKQDKNTLIINVFLVILVITFILTKSTCM